MRKKSFKKHFVLYLSFAPSTLRRFYEQFNCKHFLTSYAFIRELKEHSQREFLDWVKNTQVKDPDFILMLDSGAFSAFMSGVRIKDSEYLNFIDKYNDYFDEIIMLDRKHPTINERLFESLYQGKSWFVDHSKGNHKDYEGHIKIWESEDKIAVARVGNVTYRKGTTSQSLNEMLKYYYDLGKKVHTRKHFFATVSVRKIKLGMPHSVDIANTGTSKGQYYALLKTEGNKYYLKRYHESELPKELVSNIEAIRKKYNLPQDLIMRHHYNFLVLRKMEELINEGKMLTPEEYREKKDLESEEIFYLKENTHVKEGFVLPDLATKSIFVLNGSDQSVIEAYESVKREVEKRGIISEQTQGINYIPHFVSIVGSRAKGTADENSDLDILIRKAERDESLELLISRYLKESNIHFIYSPYGPHDSYIPLFNLKLVPCEQKVINYEAYRFQPLKLFTPPKMGSAYSFEEFYDISELTQEWAKSYFRDGINLLVEPKINGWRVLIHKKGNQLGMYFENTSKNRIEYFDKLKSELSKIDHDFIIDGELVGINKQTGKIIPRKDLGIFNSDQAIDCDRFLTSEGEEAYIQIFVFDIPYFDQDISYLPLKDRKKYLEKVKCKYIQIIDSFATKNEKELEKKINLVSNYNGSEGAVVKSEESIYTPEEIPSWAKFKKILEFKVRVIDREKTRDGRAYNYFVSYKVDGKEVEFGKTMNTKLEAEIGDILTITAQEIQLFKNGDFRISAQIPVVQDIDLSREEPDHIKDIVYRAYKMGLLHTSDTIRKEFFDLYSLKEGWVTYKGRRFLIPDMKDEETRAIRERYTNLKFIEAKGGGREHALRHPEWNGDEETMLNTIDETIRKGVVFKTQDTSNRDRLIFFSEKTNAIVIAGEKGIFNSYIVSVPEVKEYIYRLTKDAKVGVGGKL